MSSRAILISRVLFAVVLVAVTLLSLLPTPDLAMAPSDKLSHLIAYAALSLFLVLSLPEGKLIPYGLVVSLGLVLAYGVVIEIVQRYVGRQFDYLDIAADAAGVAMGAGAGLVVRRVAERFGQQSSRKTDTPAE